MNNSGSKPGPVIIGGIGGSGTRVVAEILLLFGYFLGHDLNNSKDNLTYTLLFKRPRWFRKNYKKTSHLETGLGILEKVLLTGHSLSIKEMFFLNKAVCQMSKYGHNQAGDGRGEWPHNRRARLKKSAPFDPEKYTGWGWKEPNSHLIIPAMAGYFKDFRFIHTVRHGLDMAYSDNQQQLYNWAPLFGVDIPENADGIPQASLRYWVEANKRVLELAQQIGKEKFMVVNFDKLCLDPLEGVKQIAEFLNISPEKDIMERASGLPVTPKSTGRYKEHLLDRFDRNDLAFLESMGFSYE